jgi:hypothetical protein
LTIVQMSLASRGRELPLAWLSVYIKPDTVKEALRCEHLLWQIVSPRIGSRIWRSMEDAPRHDLSINQRSQS